MRTKQTIQNAKECGIGETSKSVVQKRKAPEIWPEKSLCDVLCIFINVKGNLEKTNMLVNHSLLLLCSTSCSTNYHTCASKH
jgi:hypothetical protein